MKLINNGGDMLIRLGIIAVFLSLPSTLTAQTSNQIPDSQKSNVVTSDTATQTFTAKSTEEIRKRFAELNAQEEANLRAKQEAVGETAREKSKVDKDRAAAESALEGMALKVDG